MSEVLLPRREVERRVGLKRTAIYSRMAQGRFPQPVHDLDSTCVWWRESEIDAWVNARVAARNMGQMAEQDGEGNKKAA